MLDSKPLGPVFFSKSPIMILLFKYTPVATTTALQLNVSFIAVLTPTTFPFSVKISATSPCKTSKFFCRSIVFFISLWYITLSTCARKLWTAGPFPEFKTRIWRSDLSAFFPISPPSASTSPASWPFAVPPMLGLQARKAILSKFKVVNNVFLLSLAKARHASLPACPEPITTAS